MSDTINKQHIVILFMVVSYTQNLHKDFAEELEQWQFTDAEKKKMKMYLRLVGTEGRIDWDTQDRMLIAQVVSYIIHQAVVHKETICHTFKLIDDNLMSEWKSGIMDKEKYMNCRSNNFICKKIIEKLEALPDIGHYRLGFYDWENGSDKIEVIYG